MVDISRHPILQQAIEVCWAIEECGASPKLTDAVGKASALLQSINALLDELDSKLAEHQKGAE